MPGALDITVYRKLRPLSPRSADAARRAELTSPLAKHRSGEGRQPQGHGRGW
jgi:hypothetical protein